MRNIAIIPIRNDSTRLKNKATGIYLYKKFTPLDCIIKRLEHSKLLDEIVFIMPKKTENLSIGQAIEKYNRSKRKDQRKIKWYMGSENDITLRALESINYEKCCIVDITGDCPLIDPYQIDFLLNKFNSIKKEKEDRLLYLSNIITRSYPDGFDIQVFDSNLLQAVYPIALDKKKNTNFGWDIINYSGLIFNCFEMYNFPACEKHWHPTWELTLDYEEDIRIISAVFNYFKRFDFTVDEVIDFINDNKHLLALNKDCRRTISGE